MKRDTAAVILILLNLFDTFCTYTFMVNGLATEWNPIMGYFIHTHMMLFLITKIFIVTAFIIIAVTHYDKYLTVRIAIIILIAVYTVVAIIHMVELHSMCKLVTSLLF